MQPKTAWERQASITSFEELMLSNFGAIEDS